MNTKLRKNTKYDFGKDFYKLMNNAVFGQTMENVRKHRDIKLVTNNKKRCKLASNPNYHTPKWFSEEFLAMEIKKTKVKMNKSIYLGFLILEIIKILMYEFLYEFWLNISQNMEKKQKCIIQTQMVLSSILKRKIFIKTLHLMLINGLILLVI